MSETARPSTRIPLWAKLFVAALVIPIVVTVLALLWGGAAFVVEWVFG